jgi:hypothetical protein
MNKGSDTKPNSISNYDTIALITSLAWHNFRNYLSQLQMRRRRVTIHSHLTVGGEDDKAKGTNQEAELKPFRSDLLRLLERNSRISVGLSFRPSMSLRCATANSEMKGRLVKGL